MNSNPFSIPPRPLVFSVAGVFSAALFGLAMLTAAPRVHAADATAPLPAVPDAATVPPAAMVEQPLPPAAGQEVEEPQPSPQHVRIAAHWRWQEGHYAWIPSHWELP